jgi:excisionase family DNA binding protein
MVTSQTPIEDLPQFLTVEEWRTFMRIGRSSAYDLIRQSILPVIRLGRTVRISREAVMRFIDREGQATSVDETKVASNDERDGGTR